MNSITRHTAVVAESDGILVGFGLLNNSGYLALLYVHPEARLRGVSKSLLSALEDESRTIGIRELKLESTATALRFYERAGYSLTAETKAGFGCTQCYPMSKTLLRSGRKNFA
jgi:putative acetyltransferase